MNDVTITVPRPVAVSAERALRVAHFALIQELDRASERERQKIERMAAANDSTPELELERIETAGRAIESALNGGSHGV